MKFYNVMKTNVIINEHGKNKNMHKEMQTKVRQWNLNESGSWGGIFYSTENPTSIIFLHPFIIPKISKSSPHLEMWQMTYSTVRLSA